MRKSSYRFTLIALGLTGLLITGVVGCGDDKNPISTDQTRPTVNATNSPANNATNVPLNTNITASFSEAMSVSSVSATTFTLKQGATGVAGAVTYSAALGTMLSPTVDLAPNTVYTAMIGTGAEDLAGNGLLANFVWTFTTGAAIDATPPVVASTLPQNGASNVAISTAISAVFSEPLNPTTVTGTSFLLKRGATAVAGVITYAGNTATFTPASALSNNAEYTATLTSAVADLSGNILIQAKTWTFTTIAATDAVAPTVLSVIPANTASAIAVAANVSATFSEAMTVSSISNASFTLMQGAVPVAGAVSYSGATATFNPASNLTVNTLYTATITTGASDIAGNALASAYVWTFTTSANPDITAPMVSSTVPSSGAPNVPWIANVSATFSEAMNPASISTATFTLVQGPIQYDGVVTLSGNTMTFNPSSDLAPGSSYTATVLTGVTDLAGNALASNYSWTFTTVAPVPPPDITRPTVLVTVPANNANPVAASIALAVAFSERVAPASISAATFKLMQGTTPIAGVVTSFGTAASFEPTSPLTSLLVYTATITTGVTDLAGNALATNYVWSFTIDGDVNTDAPIVISVTPVDEEIDVTTVSNITATFSESMNSATISSATFTVTDGSGAIAGAVSYSGRTATFNPSSPLAPSSFYAATITTGARDAAGTAVASDYTWVFSTEAIPQVTGVVPTVDGLNLPVTAKVAASFTKPMNPASLTTESFVVRTGGNWIPGIVTTVGPAVVFDPTSNLSPNTVYTATLTTAATDISGNPLAFDVSWSFTTGSNSDVAAPIVTASDPANGATNVPRGGTIRVFFSDAIDPTTLTSSSFKVTVGSSQAAGTVSYPETIGIFTPSVLLAPSTVYTVTVTTAVKDISGNAFAAPKVWTFTTRP